MTCSVFPIIEGHGEVAAVPLLLRRFVTECLGVFDFHCFSPHRLPRSKIVDQQQIARVTELGCSKIRERGGYGFVLCLLDADDDCPATLAPRILNAMSNVWPAIPKSVVVAQSEYESWLLASAVSLRAHASIRPDATPPAAPENIRDAKGYLHEHLMVRGRYYSPSVDQVALTAHLDFSLARACSSFDKFVRDMTRLVPVAN